MLILDFSVWSDKCAAFSRNVLCAVYTVHWSVCRIKCTCADSGAFAGAGEMHNAHRPVCRVQFAACKNEDLAIETDWVKF